VETRTSEERPKQNCTCTDTCARRSRPFPAEWSWRCQGFPYVPTELDMHEKQLEQRPSNPSVERLKVIARLRGILSAREALLIHGQQGMLDMFAAAEKALNDAGAAHETYEPHNLALQKGANVLWERQFKGTPWEGKVGLINPDSMEEYRALAYQVWKAIEQHRPQSETNVQCNHDLQSPTKTLKATLAPHYGWSCTVCKSEWYPPGMGPSEKADERRHA